MSQDKRVSRHVQNPHREPAMGGSAARGPAGPQAPATPPRSLIEILLHRKWTVIFWVALALGLGAVYQHYTPPKYESRAEIVVLRANPDAPASPLASTGLSSGSPTTHASILLSTSVLESALQDPAIAQSSLLDGVKHPLHFLRKELQVTASDETETVSIRFIDEDPNAAAALITAIVHAYFAHQGLPVRGMTQDDEADHPTASVMDEQVIASQLMFLSQQVGEAKIKADLARSRRDRAIASGRDINQLQQLLREADADTQTIGTVSLMSMNDQLSRLDQQLQSMPESWGAEHRLRVPVQQQYDALSERYYHAEQAVRQQAIAQLESAYGQADAHRAELETQFAQLQAQADQARTSPIRVIDPPRVATRKSSPIAMKSFGVAGFLGLVLGGFFAVRTEMRHPAPVAQAAPIAQAQGPWEVAPVALTALMRSQDDLEQVETIRDIPLLGAVPELSTGDRLTTPNFTSTASSIHQIRAVLQVQAHAKGTQSYAFTSPRRGAGKTSVAIGVASSLAVAGTRTLVVDCDLAGRIVRGQTGRPANPGHIDPFGPIDRQIGSPHNQSLDDIAVGQGYIKAERSLPPASSARPPKVGIVGMLEGRSLEQCAVKATVNGLWLLPASEAETRHIGQMSDTFIRDLLHQARDQFDLVLFDTGPVPGSVEALLVTSQADGVIIVVPHGESGKALDRTVSYLKVVSAKVIGTVFNHAKTTGPDSFEQAAAQADQPETNRAPRYNDDDEPDEDELADDIGHDIDEAMGSVPLGSGILAAAVFADKNSGFASDDWELKGTSDFPGDTAPPNKNPAHTKPIEVSDILPPD